MAVLLNVDFGKTPLGHYSLQALQQDFGEVLFAEGLERVAIVEAPQSPSGRALLVRYPKGAVGPRVGGAQWRVRLPSAHRELYAAYSLCFTPGFDFVKGGKLPGLVGGSANTGGSRPNGHDGFSARMMWRAGGQVVQYIYHPDQPAIWGEDFCYEAKGPSFFSAGRWHTVEHGLVLNTPDNLPRNPALFDGSIQGFLDGKLCLNKRGLRFRDSAALLIDQFYFSTFFGGAEPDWAPVKDEAILFDRFCVATAPILF